MNIRPTWRQWRPILFFGAAGGLLVASLRFIEYLIEKERAAGAPPEQLQATAQRMEEFKRLYQNPLVNIAFMFLEPFPVGFLVSLISAGVLRRRAGPGLATASMLVRGASGGVTSGSRQGRHAEGCRTPARRLFDFRRMVCEPRRRVT